MLVHGLKLGCVYVPLDKVYLKSDLVTGTVPLGVRTVLPVEEFSLILGTNLAGGKVFLHPIVVDTPNMSFDWCHCSFSFLLLQ